MDVMDGFDDVSVVASVDESPPVPRRVHRAFTAVVASVVLTGALAGAAVGLADEKTEPAKSAAPAGKSFSTFKRDGRECRKGERHQRSSDSSALRY
jgi:uncharacterized membrane protein